MPLVSLPGSLTPRLPRASTAQLSLLTEPELRTVQSCTLGSREVGRATPGACSVTTRLSGQGAAEVLGFAIGEEFQRGRWNSGFAASRWGVELKLATAATRTGQRPVGIRPTFDVGVAVQAHHGLQR